MRTLEPAADSATHPCPLCGGDAVVHARVARAIHDWQTTFVECVRLRCCGRTFTVWPEGLRPWSRHSARVVAVARTLFACGVSLRSCARLLTRSGTPASAETVRAWCRGVSREAQVEAHLSRALPELGIELRPGLWFAFQTQTPEVVRTVIAREADRA
jgi:hypothetical protein